MTRVELGQLQPAGLTQPSDCFCTVLKLRAAFTVLKIEEENQKKVVS